MFLNFNSQSSKPSLFQLIFQGYGFYFSTLIRPLNLVSLSICGSLSRNYSMPSGDHWAQWDLWSSSFIWATSFFKISSFLSALDILSNHSFLFCLRLRRSLRQQDLDGQLFRFPTRHSTFMVRWNFRSANLIPVVKEANLLVAQSYFSGMSPLSRHIPINEWLECDYESTLLLFLLSQNDWD